MITANDLRNTAQIHDNSTQAHFLKFVTSEATPSIEDLHFRNCLTFECNSSSSFFFVLGCMTTALIEHGYSWHVFDSHSCSEQNVSTQDGKSVLLKVQDFFELAKYLEFAYLEVTN